MFFLIKIFQNFGNPSEKVPFKTHNFETIIKRCHAELVEAFLSTHND